MPIPFLLGALAVGAGVLGAAGHSVANDTNKEAEEIVERAKRLFNRTKNELDDCQKETETALLYLGKKKKDVLDTSMKRFIEVYNRIKHIELRQSSGIMEISKFDIDEAGAVEMKKLTVEYAKIATSGVAGAATGALIGLAASGFAPIVASGVSLGLTLGSASVVGSSLAMGLSATPIGAILAPALLFSGFSASSKADKNKETAKQMLAEVRYECSKMETSIVLCKSITEKSNEFRAVLLKIIPLFESCILLTDKVSESHIKKYKTLDVEKLSQEELNLFAVTRAIAGAVKAIIDTPIINNSGEISHVAIKKYEELVCEMPNFENAVSEIKLINYKAASIRHIKEYNARNSKLADNVWNKMWETPLYILLIAIIMYGFCPISLMITIIDIKKTKITGRHKLRSVALVILNILYIIFMF